MGPILDLDDLPHTEHAHEFVGYDHGDVPRPIRALSACRQAGRRSVQPTVKSFTGRATTRVVATASRA